MKKHRGIKARIGQWLLDAAIDNQGVTPVLSALTLDYRLIETLIDNATEGTSIVITLKDGTRMEFLRRSSGVERTANGKYY